MDRICDPLALSHHGKKHLWRKQLYEWQRSGMTVKGFCQVHNIPRRSFYRWRHELHLLREGNDTDQRLNNGNYERIVPFAEVKMIDEISKMLSGLIKGADNPKI